MLEVRNLSAGYGSIHVIRDINLKLGDKLICLLGPNGAGKTTTLKSLAGLIRPIIGEIYYEGQPLHTLRTEKLVRKGIVLVPEGRDVLATLTVQENLELGAYVRHDREVRSDLKRMYDLFPVLGERRFLPAGNLSGGEQQMLAIGRALMARPKVLMLDEPSLGLAPLIVRQVFKVLQEINRQGLPMILVEQNTKMALTIADYAYVIRNGVIVQEGQADKLRNDSQLVEAYLA